MYENGISGYCLYKPVKTRTLISFGDISSGSPVGALRGLVEISKTKDWTGRVTGLRVGQRLVLDRLKERPGVKQEKSSGRLGSIVSITNVPLPGVSTPSVLQLEVSANFNSPFSW